MKCIVAYNGVEYTLSYDDAAKMTGCTTHTIRTYINRYNRTQRTGVYNKKSPHKYYTVKPGGPFTAEEWAAYAPSYPIIDKPKPRQKSEPRQISEVNDKELARQIRAALKREQVAAELIVTDNGDDDAPNLYIEDLRWAYHQAEDTTGAYTPAGLKQHYELKRYSGTLNHCAKCHLYDADCNVYNVLCHTDLYFKAKPKQDHDL